MVEVTAYSNAATTSQVVRVNLVAPTPTPTATLTPTSTPPAVTTAGSGPPTAGQGGGTMTPTPPAVTTAGSGPPTAGQGGSSSSQRPIGASDLLLAVVGIVTAAGGALAMHRSDAASPSAWLRIGLVAVIAGLAGYLVYGLGAHALGDLWAGLRPWAAGAVAFAFGLAPAAVSRLQVPG
jgi:hypothetical protein